MIPDIPQEKKRIFILTPGRCGSSFLASLLSDAGATFPGETASTWSPLKGAYESKESGKAAFLFAQAHDIRNSHKYSLIYRLFYKKIVTYKRALGKYKTRKLLEKATCIKETANIHFLPRVSAFMGYWPVIVLNYRDFPECMGSKFPGQRYFSVETLTQDYISTLENAVALLGLFGGCVVNYSDLMDVNSEDWAHVLGEVTGLDGQVILESRNRRYRDPGPETFLPVRLSRVEEILALIREYEGRAIPPAPSAIKRWLKD
jgi:hypothetical protein